MKKISCVFAVVAVLSGAFPKGGLLGAEEIKVVVSARCLFGGIILAQEEFQKSSGIQVQINKICAGLGKGAEAVIQGRADIGTLARELNENEKKAGIVATCIARDGIAINVNRSNAVENLSHDGVRKIFLGQVSNWEEVGGEKGNIIIIRSLCGASEVDAIDTILLQGEKPLETIKVIETDIGDLVIEKLAEYPTGIAALSPLFSSAEVKRVKINGRLPDRDNITDGSYPLVRPLYLVTKGEPTGKLKKYVDFMLSEKGQKMMDKALRMDWLKEGF